MRKAVLFIVACLAALAVLPAVAQAATATFSPTDDVQLRNTTPDAPGGPWGPNDPEIWVCNGCGTVTDRGFLRFNAALPAGATVTGVRLSLSDSGEATANGPAVKPTSANWTESTITWNTQPAMGAALANAGAISSGQRYTYTLPASSVTGGPVSFALDGDSADSVSFHSFEATTASVRPSLAVDYTTPPPTTQCSDGVDNADPEDTLVDLADPGCTDASDNDETDPAPPPPATCSGTTVSSGLQTAINNAANGTTLCLAYNHTGNITVPTTKTNLTVKSADSTRRTIDGNLIVYGNGTTFERLNFRDSRSSGPYSWIARGDDTEFLYDDFSNGNRRIGLIVGSSTEGGAGADRAFRTVVRYSRLHHIGVSDNHQHCIYVEGSVDAVIHGSVLYNCADRAIQHYPDAQRTTTTQSILSDSGNGTVFTGDGAGNTSNDNVIDSSLITFIRTWLYDACCGTGNQIRNSDLFSYGSLGGGSGTTLVNNSSYDPRYVNKAAGDYTPQDSRAVALLSDPNIPFRPF